MPLPKISVFIAVSLDGYIARVDGAIDWLDLVQQPGEDYGYRAFYETVDAVILGRNTYDKVLGFDAWPFEGKPVTVLTHRPLAPLHGEAAHDGPLGPLAADLANRGVKRVYLDGGAAVRQALSERLVDDLILSWIPVVLGSGLPLFARGLPESGWRLTRSQSFPTGLLQATYERADRADEPN